ncbi:MAG: hypothetical protein J7L20_00765 [Thermoplasmata archaeon]|nr:hypothetical protein [Thermoplasmata archaeon]
MRRILIIGILCLVLLPSAISFEEIESDDLETGQQAEILDIPDDVKITAREKLSQVRVACFYMTITDGRIFNRSYDDVVDILRGVKTDLVFGAFHHWITCPECCEDIFDAPPECIEPSNLQEQYERCREHGYSFAEFQNATEKIKAELPDVMICVSLPLEFLNPCSRNSITGEILLRNETWEMALDPSKWGIPVTREEFQTWWAKRHGWMREEPYNPKEEMPFYFPDPSNPEFQELFLSHAKRLIDAGADAIWIDMLFMPSLLLGQLTGDINHIAVRETFEASSEIVDKIHEYGYSKYGKYIYVGSWGTAANFPYQPPDLDFITGTVHQKEILNMEMDESEWEEKLAFLKEKMPNVTIFVFFDYGYDNSPMEIFSQMLSPQEQREFLRIADEFFERKGIAFIYPVHGPDMGPDAKILSYGKSRCYDSLAPEFQTYDTIVELAKNRKKPLVRIERPRNYLYLFDREIVPSKIPIVIGSITVTAHVLDEEGIERVEFYVDNALKMTVVSPPYLWLWDEFAIGRHEIKVIAYDIEGKVAGDEQDVWIFNL